MKILHTADWHLGKRLENFSRLPEQHEVLQEICEIAEREAVDLVVLAGDIFDNFNPPTEAVDLLYKTLKRLTRGGTCPVIAIAGNHDSAERIESPDPLARSCGIIFSGLPNTIVPTFQLDNSFSVTKTDEGFIEIQLPNFEYPARIIHLPYVSEMRLKTAFLDTDADEGMRELITRKWTDLSEKYCNNEGVNLLVSHLYFQKSSTSTSIEESEDEKSILHVGGAPPFYSHSVPEAIQYTALGHLHRCHNVDKDRSPIVYSGSPLSYSFSEAEQQKYVCIVNLAPNEPASYEKIPLSLGKPLTRQKFDSIDVAIQWLIENPACLVELTIVSDTFLSGADKKRLTAAHDGIIHIIPQVEGINSLPNEGTNTIDLNQNISTLFEQFFEHKNGQKPSESLTNLFQEILSTENE